MNRVQGWWLRLRRASRQSDFEADMAAEMRAHIEHETARRIATGEDPTTARRRAIAEFGSIDARSEEVRDNRLGARLSDGIRRHRLAVRALLRQPAFTTLMVTILTIGLTAGSMMFAVMDSVLLRDLPFPESDRVVRIAATRQEDGYVAKQSASGPLIHAWRERASSFEHLAIFRQHTVTFARQGVTPEQLPILTASPSLYPIVGLSTRLGRPLTAADSQPGADAVVVLSDQTWSAWFNRSPDAIGQTVLINSLPARVVGVLQSNAFLGLFPTRTPPLLLRPFVEPIQDLHRGSWNYNVIAKLRDGVAVDAVRAEMDAVARTIQRDMRDISEDSLTAVDLLQDDRNATITPALWATATLTSLLLLITLVNATKLYLVRTIARDGEFAVRVALGASRWSLARQILAECSWLVGAAAVASLLIMPWGIELVARFGPTALTSLADLQLTSRVAAFVAGGTLLAIVALAGFASTRLRGNPTSAGPTQRTSSFNRRQSRLLHALVGVQFVIATAVLVSAGLMLTSFVRLAGEDPGFDPSNRLSFRVRPPAADYPDRDSRLRLFEEILQRSGALPGVSAASGSSAPPLSNEDQTWGFWFVDGRSEPEGQPLNSRHVLPDYFSTMGMTLLRGRSFDATDTPDSPPVMIIDETLARNHFSGEAPIGRTIKFGWQSQPMEIVGIIRDVRHNGLRGESEAAFYIPAGQVQVVDLASMSFVLRGDIDPTTLVPLIRDQVRQTDPDLPISAVATLEDWHSDAMALERFIAELLAVFSIITVFVTAVGLYGVISYILRRRHREFGIRIAVGARSSQIAALVYRQSMASVLGGIGLGLFAAWAAAGLIGSLLYQVSTTDAGTYGAVAAVLLIAAAAALGIPTLRATRINPSVALRSE